MSSAKHACHEDKLEPISLREGDATPTKPAAKEANYAISFKPNQLPKPSRIKVETEEGWLNAQKTWATFVKNKQILKSPKRAKLKQHLEDLLDGLQKRYIDNNPQIFPSCRELVKLTQVIFALAKLLGVKKFDFMDLLGAIRRIKNRCSKIPLLVFADALRDRLLQIPMCPSCVVANAAKMDPANKEMLGAIKAFLCEGTTAGQTTPWESWYQSISRLEFPTSELVPSSNSQQAQPTRSPDQKKLLAYLLLMDLRRQQLEWKAAYGKTIEPSLQWIYRLLRPDDFTRIQQRFCSDVWSPEKIKAQMSKWGSQNRRNRSYRKTHGKQVNAKV